MKVWKCPNCKRVRKWEYDLVLKICPACQIKMEEFEDGER